MSFMSRLIRPAPRPDSYAVPPEWMPPSNKMKRVILHWTAGSYTASALDQEHYHFLIDGRPKLVRGLHSVIRNEFIGKKSQDEYAAHTKGTNTGSIGISLCGSAGAVEYPFNAGKFPIKEAQWQLAAEVTATLCRRYSIPVTPKTVLSHAEVQSTLGIRQNGKWDIAKLTFGKGLVTAEACGDDFRRRVQEQLK